ncbi:MAG TPA: hypothetical protein VGE27_16635 [Gemmatimonas sp.]|uniref:hypothetical protein n=1 Tax=Gemmatimonas sp. TaxID=1962908 RepID=UPI002EDA6E55
MSLVGPISVRVVGMVRGREVDALGTASLETDGLVIAWPPAAAWRLDLDGIDGVALANTSLTVYLREHDVLELSGDGALRTLGQGLLDLACRVPEMMRGGRASGLALSVSHDTGLQGAHDRWLAPLLSVRRAIQGVTDPERQVALLDGSRLADDMLRALTEIAAIRYPEDAAQQRALEAAMEDEAEPMFDALERVAMAAADLRGGAMDTRIADWRRWIVSVQETFSTADEAWNEIRELLEES